MSSSSSSKKAYAYVDIPMRSEGNPAAYEMVRRMGGSKAVVVFGRSQCYMFTEVKKLLHGLGVDPEIIDLDNHPAGADIEASLSQLYPESANVRQPLPAVFVGGKFLGGVETLTACDNNGTLVPLLKQVGALWL